MNTQTLTTRRPARPGITRQRSLKAPQLTGYFAGAVGTAALLGAPQTQAAVVYWDPTDRVATPTNQGFNFDMLTGVVRTAIARGDYTATSFAVWNFNSPDYNQITDGRRVVTENWRISNLTLGTTIGSASTFPVVTEPNFDYKGSASYPWNTELDGTTGFVGLQFDDSGTHYGWARFTYDDATTGNITLHDFAYESVAGQSITAGAGIAAAPEPSRALLALAGFGAVALRRRRKLAA
jgi:MYXO-CTERM domain-containing protein